MSQKQFYITTAINYTNGSPHFGHAYEAVVADCLARYHRICGENVFFLTGTDEHGQKIADTAANQKPKLTPLELCDKYVAEFQSLNDGLNISNDFYIRTTMDKHEACAKNIWIRCAENDDIYMGRYEGWYSKREERFVTEFEAQSMNLMDGTTPLIKTSESSYFFKLSKYHDRIVQHITNNPDFIFPSEKRNEILERLKEPLTDLSISRTSFDWGIPIPENFKGNQSEEKHVMYVWFDALTNYLSGVDYPDGSLAHFWPSDIHLIGKDIAWFHAVIWPCMLFSASIPLPKRIVCHGFVNGPDGRKMSKTWGNIVDPVQLLTQYTSDTVRYFMLREGIFGADFSFGESKLQERYNADLANNLGNIVQRSLSLADRYCCGIVPDNQALQIFDINNFSQKIQKNYDDLNLQGMINQILDILVFINKWLTDSAPWNLKNEEDIPKQRSIVKTLLEAIYVICHFVWPIMPDVTETIFIRLNNFPVSIPELILNQWKSLKVGVPVILDKPLFPRIGDTRIEKKQKQQEKLNKK